MKKENIGSSLVSLFEETGELGEVTALAVKKMVAEDIADAMKELHLNVARLSNAIGTSRSAVSRLVDPTETGVTLDTLSRAADALDRKLVIRFERKARVRTKKATSARNPGPRVAS